MIPASSTPSICKAPKIPLKTIQINAIKSAIHSVGQIVLEGHIRHCVKDGIEHGDAEKTIEEFAEVIRQFSKL